MAKTIIDVNNLDSNKGFEVKANAPYDVASARAIGDINGDGFTDLIVNEYVFFGGENVAPSGQINSSQLNGQNGFRFKVSNSDLGPNGDPVAVGDINNDGFADFLLPYQEGNEYKTLQVFGGNNIGNSGTLEIDNLIPANSLSGSVTTSFGDINGDGANEFAVMDKDGNVSYVFGSPNSNSPFDPNNSFQIVGGRETRAPELSSTGDINGDGFEDLLITDNDSRDEYPGSVGQTVDGKGYVVFGGPDVAANGKVDISALNGRNGFRFSYGEGSLVRPFEVGDLNGDGFNELAIEANSAHKVYVLYGKENGFAADINLQNLNPSDGFTIDNTSTSAMPYAQITSAGDFNGDGFNDLALNDVARFPSGESKVDIVYGGQNIGGTIDLNQLDSNSGATIKGAGLISSTGDMNGDGATDLVVQGFNYDYLQPNSSVHVIYGESTGTTTPPTSGNTFVGDSNANQLTGTAGNDLIRGRGGNDTLDGLAGNDEIRGGGGRDLINGGSGDDIIAGGNGKDIMTGGAGADTFVYKDLSNRKDRITDFEVGKDKIDVSAIFDDSDYASNNAFGEYIQVVSSGSDTRVRIDLLGDNGDNFKTLAILEDVNPSQVNADSFMV